MKSSIDPLKRNLECFVSIVLFIVGLAGTATQALEFEVLERNPVLKDCPQTLRWGRAHTFSERLCYHDEDTLLESTWNADLSKRGIPASDQWDGTYAPTTSGLYEHLFSGGNGGNYVDHHVDASQSLILYGRTIRLTGEIKKGDSARLATFLDENDIVTCAYANFCPYAGVISLDSPGGNLAEALRLADLIRNYQFATLLEEDSRCESSCAFLFFAGYTNYAGFFFPRRFAHETALIGVHQPRLEVPGGQYNAEQLNDAVQIANTVQSQALTSFVDSRIDMLVLKQMYATPSHDMSYLTPARMGRVAQILGRDFARAETLAREQAINFCAGEYELQSGRPPAPTLLDNLVLRKTAFVTYEDAGDFACYGTRMPDNRWLVDACFGQDCLIALCTLGPEDFSGDGPSQDQTDANSYKGLCPSDEAAGARFKGETFRFSLGIALDRLQTRQRLAYVSDVLNDHFAFLTSYQREQSNFFLSTFDAQSRIPVEYCGRIDFGARKVVMLLQTALNSAGFDAGPEDGLMGPRTAQAIRDANSQRLSLSDLRPSETLLQALGVSSEITKTLRLCAQG